MDSNKIAFGNNVCDLCGHRHPSGFDCVADKARKDAEFSASLEQAITKAVDPAAKIKADLETILREPQFQGIAARSD